MARTSPVPEAQRRACGRRAPWPEARAVVSHFHYRAKGAASQRSIRLREGVLLPRLSDSVHAIFSPKLFQHTCTCNYFAGTSSSTTRQASTLRFQDVHISRLAGPSLIKTDSILSAASALEVAAEARRFSQFVLALGTAQRQHAFLDARKSIPGTWCSARMQRTDSKGCFDREQKQFWRDSWFLWPLTLQLRTSVSQALERALIVQPSTSTERGTCHKFLHRFLSLLAVLKALFSPLTLCICFCSAQLVSACSTLGVCLVWSCGMLLNTQWISADHYWA